MVQIIHKVEQIEFYYGSLTGKMQQCLFNIEDKKDFILR